MRTLRAMLLALAGLAPAASEATVIVTLTPAAASVAVGETVTVDVVGEFSAPHLVLAWGLDLVLDPTLVAVSGAPVIGPTWLAFATPDGDGLGGVALAGVTGTHLLATLTLEGLAPGLVQLGLAVNARDRTEGFALDPTGFASGVVFSGASLLVVPEPRLLVLAALAALAAACRRRASWPVSAPPRASGSAAGARPRRTGAAPARTRGGRAH